MFNRSLFAAALLLTSFACTAQKKSDNNPKKDEPDSLKNISMPGLSFRSIGPAITGGRIVDIAVNPQNTSEYYVASGHGNLWKTVNNGNTFKPVFDGQASFSMGAVRIDPSNSANVWVGTGEANNQSNVIYGDGVYKSEDAGSSWKNMGLKNSEHIGGIAIDPTNSDVVYVAAYGSMRNPGGDRGIFKTNDGGKSWRNVLKISENTGCFEVHMDPRYNTLLYAVAHQRMRKGTTNVGGGPETAIYRTVDSGATWQKIMKGLPSESVGRIGLAISPANPDVVYALVQAKEGSGLYRSNNRGATWSKQSSYNSAYPFYMQKIYADPKNVDKLYSMDLYNQVSMDGGKTFKRLGEKGKHVDNHVIWIDPQNTAHLIAGCDGGVYESWDMGQNWDFNANIPIAEVYKVSTDNASPFYHVYIGTQDNSSLCGPSRTMSVAGITNRDWWFTVGGDGFETQADWKDDNTLYAQYQNGGLMRYNKKTGELLSIRPINMIDTGYRFDWDAPLLISQFDHNRLYFAANKLFRTDNQGSGWKIISPDLTNGVPQQMEKVMGRSWSIDELASKGSTANITCIAESPLDENMLFVGTGDGVIQFTKDGGQTWTKASSTGLSNGTRVHYIAASHFNKNVAYAACQGYINGDYEPHLLQTTDGGNTWTSINANLPKKGSTFCILEDHVDKDLLFAGTQFGLYTSTDGGKEWIKFMNGLPTCTVMDMEIHRSTNDLVLGTFGRGVYILDDYSALRTLKTDTLAKKAAILEVQNGQMFVEKNDMPGFAGEIFQGTNFYRASNPPVGASITYFIKDDSKSLKDKRRDKEQEIQKKGGDIEYPSYDELRKEGDEQDPFLLLTIRDTQGNVVRKIKTAIAKGVRRINWDMRYDDLSPLGEGNERGGGEEDEDENSAYMVLPGSYTVSMSQFENGSFKELAGPVAFECKPLFDGWLSEADKNALMAFNKKLAELSRAMNGAESYRREMANKIPLLKQASLYAGSVPTSVYEEVLAIDKKMDEINRQFNGDGLRGRYEGSTPVSLRSRVNQIVGSLWNTTQAPTQAYMASYDVAADGFGDILSQLKELNSRILKVEAQLEHYKAPYTPGRLPDWKKG